MVVVNIPVDEEMEKKLGELDDRLNNFKFTLSEARKKGFFTFFADQLMYNYIPLVKMVRVTYDPNDLQKIDDLITLAEKEIEAAKEGSDFDKAMSDIRDIFNLLREGKFDEAETMYSHLRRYYEKLPEDERRLLYKACNEIHRKITAKEKA